MAKKSLSSSIKALAAPYASQGRLGKGTVELLLILLHRAQGVSGETLCFQIRMCWIYSCLPLLMHPRLRGRVKVAFPLTRGRPVAHPCTLLRAAEETQNGVMAPCSFLGSPLPQAGPDIFLCHAAPTFVVRLCVEKCAEPPRCHGNQGREGTSLLLLIAVAL